MDPAYYITAAIAVSIALMQIDRRAPSPIVALCNRWLRWGIFSTGFALIISYFKLADYSYHALAAIFALLWFLGETLYNWLAVKAISESPLPLFPKYSVSPSGEEWPAHPRFLKLRDQLRNNGFSHVQSLRAELAEDIWLRISVYNGPRDETRLQVTFLPQASGALSVCMSLSTLTASGHRYVTDNVHVPFAGFYPENWLVDRSPWTRSLRHLIRRHNDRLARDNEKAGRWTTEPLADLNAGQLELEQLNTELGFLTPHAEREEFGKVTNAGRYRVWKELWTLNYLGRSARYI